MNVPANPLSVRTIWIDELRAVFKVPDVDALRRMQRTC